MCSSDLESDVMVARPAERETIYNDVVAFLSALAVMTVLSFAGADATYSSFTAPPRALHDSLVDLGGHIPTPTWFALHRRAFKRCFSH